MSARDLARFGLLYLREGRWEERQILPASWVRESTRARTVTGRLGTKSGYGYMWWVTAPGGVLPDARLPVGSFTASGSGGQRLTVIPTLDTVVVHLMNTDREGAPRVGTDDWNEFLEMLLAARTD
jgi:CubicO group peptidase (beta-lactamase class C family)